jgi:RsiW-degrading membrane proteinase PrsW (M82 family)
MSPDGRTDPVEESTNLHEDVDLYEVATWEERSRLDGFAVAVYRLLSASTRWVVILLGAVLFLGIGGFSAITDPAVGVLTALSAIPALGLALYVYVSDVTSTEPPSLLLGTFLLGVITATFAAVLNSLVQPVFGGLGFLGLVLFFYLFVAPVEEAVKLLAVRLYAYRDSRFGAVVDGAVYGAMAGLGFAFIENALYIERGLMGTEVGGGLALIGAGAEITFTRALAGPGHVIYSAFAGYYLGLAKFNPENRGPIVVKGIVIAALVHATYNTTVGIGSTAFAFLGLPPLAAAFAYILLYDGLFGALLFRKLRRYRRTYHEVEAGERRDGLTPEGVGSVSGAAVPDDSRGGSGTDSRAGAEMDSQGGSGTDSRAGAEMDSRAEDSSVGGDTGR